MRQKITILTILVGGLAVLSFFIVYGDIKNRSELSKSRFQNFGPALINASLASENFNSQTGYILPVSEPTYFPIRKPDVAEPLLKAKSFLLYDVKNAKVLFSKDPQKALPIASLTKLLTAIVSLENLSPETVIEIGPESMNVDQEGADFYLKEKFYFQDLFKVMLVKSSNDAASAIARAIEVKTGTSFADLMNKKALQIGMNNSRFLDSAGLNDSAYSTVEDLLKLARNARRFEEIRESLAEQTVDVFSIDKKLKHHFISTNKLFGILPDMVGAKTGYTDGALGCIILEEALLSSETSLIAIVLGSTERLEDAEKLVNWGKSAFRWELN